MSNEKSFIKRAMQVQLKTGAKTVSKEDAEAVDSQAKPKTGPGAFVAHLAKTDEVRIENTKLLDDLKTWQDAKPVKHLDARFVHPSKWMNRLEESFCNDDFLALKNDIESSGGNVQAIKVRETPGSDPKVYEIIFGHRRHRACLELGLPVLAVIENNISDIDLFKEMDRENRARKDLRPYEQGLIYKKVLNEKLFPSLRSLAQSIGVNAGLASRYVALASLPDVVIKAFESPLDLQYAWATKLSEVHTRYESEMIERAKLLCERAPRLNSTLVYQKLIEPTNQHEAKQVDSSVASNNSPAKRMTKIFGGSGERGFITSNPKMMTLTINIKNIQAHRMPELESLIQ